MLLLELNETLVTCSIVRRLGSKLCEWLYGFVRTSTQRPVDKNGGVV